MLVVKPQRRLRSFLPAAFLMIVTGFIVFCPIAVAAGDAGQEAEGLKNPEAAKDSAPAAGTAEQATEVSAAPARDHHAASGLPRNVAAAKGSAITPPRMNPFVLKSDVGSQGSKMGNKTTPDKMAVAAPAADSQPLKKNNTTAAASIGSRTKTSSTGIKTSRSVKAKRASRISGVAV